MLRIRLRTLGTVALAGPDGAIVLDEPRLVALVVLLAIAGDAGASEDELLLRLTPDATAERGRADIARLVGIARQRLGAESSVLRTASGYALAPGAIELDVRVLSSDAPTECAEFLADFKLPGSPEFREWVAATRRRVTPAVNAPAAGIASRAKGLFRWPTAVALGVLAVAGGLYFGLPRSASGFARGNPLIVADLRNETGDSVFDVGLMTAATTGLQQSGLLRLYPRSRLPVVYQLMQITNRDTALTFELAQDVAQREGVRFVLGLQIDRAGDAYRVTGRLADVSAPNRVTEHTAVARSRKDVLGALSDVLVDVRRTLGESRRDIADRGGSLPLVTTASLEALRAYGDGSVAWTKGNFVLARDFWNRAVDIDTGFAMAYGALGGFYSLNHNREVAEHYYGEAFKRESRLSEWERLRMLNQLLAYRGNLDSSAVVAGVLAARYPNVSTWYNYGTDLMRAKRDSQAILALRTALTFDSSHIGSYINLATIANRQKRFDDALAYYGSANKVDSMVLYRNNLNHEWGSTFVVLGRYAEAESVFRRMARQPDVASRGLGLRSLGYLALWRGRPDESVDAFQQAVLATVQTRSFLGEARNRMLLATAYRTVGRDREAGDEVSRVLALINGPTFEPAALALVATSCIKLGRVADAERVLQLLSSRVNRGSAVDVAAELYAKGVIALAKHSADSALHDVLAAGALQNRLQVVALTAEAYRAVGQADSARAAVGRLIDERGFGVEGQDDWLHAPLVLGDLLLARGDTAGATKEYQRLLDQWRGAPSTLPDVAAARTRIASLVGDRRRD